MSEFNPEIPPVDLYNHLLVDARTLHLGALIDDVYGKLTVNEHNDTHTNMTAGDPWQSVYHFSTDIIPAGVLLRQIASTRDEDQRYIQSEIVLLSTSQDSKMIRTREFAMDKCMQSPSHDTDRIVAVLKEKGQPLDTATMQTWDEEIRTIMSGKLSKEGLDERRQSAGGKLKRILGGHLKQAS